MARHPAARHRTASLRNPRRPCLPPIRRKDRSFESLTALSAVGHVGWCAEAVLSRGAITGLASDPAQLWTPRPGVGEVLLLGEGSSKDPQTARELYEGARARLAALGLKTHLIVPRHRWDLDLDVADIVAAFTLRDFNPCR